MNLALSDEQGFLREAARGALSRFKTIEAAREALEGGELPDLWPTAREAGWPGLLISEQHGGAGLGVFDAMLVLGECGRVLAGIPLLGHLPASALLDSAGADGLEQLASGEQRAAYLPARPPGDVQTGWSGDSERGLARAPAPTIAPRADGDGGDGAIAVSGAVCWVPDAPGADLLVGVGLNADGRPTGFCVAADASGVQVDSVTRYDSTRALGNVTLDEAPGVALELTDQQLAFAWYLAQALLAAESLGSVETALEMALEYAKERHTFGRPIGSYQAVKHALVEVLRRLENGRSLLYYAGWAGADSPDEFALAASAARSTASGALDFAARELIAVHGGIGATWEHDAPLYFRRSQLSRRLLGGSSDATDRVAGELISAA